jgi:uracil-DNA glycosylase family 4
MQQLNPTSAMQKIEIDPFLNTSGSRTAKILIVGEAWGVEEATARKPFLGHAGRELDRMLHEAGINKLDCLFTCVMNAKPTYNDFTGFLTPTKEKKTAAATIRGIHCKPELLKGLTQLQNLISTLNPSLIIGCGNWPLWALTDKTSVANSSKPSGYKIPAGVSSWRGSQIFTLPINGKSYPYLPIIHPSSILRDWSLRARTVHDLRIRAGRFISKSRPDWTEPEWNFNSSPTFSEINSQLDKWINLLSKSELELSVDLETYQRKFIACIGIDDGELAICIPLFTITNDKLENYLTVAQESQIQIKLKLILEHPNCKIIGQNFNYDTQWFLRHMNINAIVKWDTMLMHHLAFPGTPKSLDYLSSLYCDHHFYWKDESDDWDLKQGGMQDLWKYNCRDIRKTFQIAQELKTVLRKLNMEKQYQWQLNQWELARAMEIRGVRADQQARAQMNIDLIEAANIVGHRLLMSMPENCRYTSAGQPWYTSPIFSQHIFYERIGLQPVLHKKTRRPTLDNSSLPVLRKRAPWLTPVFNDLEIMRSIGVFRSHFIDVPLAYDKRFKCSFNVGGTVTFRWSSNSNSFGEGTNLQNIPKGDK